LNMDGWDWLETLIGGSKSGGSEEDDQKSKVKPKGQIYKGPDCRQTGFFPILQGQEGSGFVTGVPEIPLLRLQVSIRLLWFYSTTLSLMGLSSKLKGLEKLQACLP